MATQTGDSKPAAVNTFRLASAHALDSQGRKVPLGLLWANNTVVFVFLRHFACIGCRGHAAQVWGDREKYESTGAKIVFIGNGSPDFIQKFREDLGLGDALILTDPSLESYKAAGFRHGFFAVVQPLTLAKVVKLASKGHKQVSYSKESGTHWQLGGVVVMSKLGKVLYHFISESVGDHPPDPEVEVLSRAIHEDNSRTNR